MKNFKTFLTIVITALITFCITSVVFYSGNLNFNTSSSTENTIGNALQSSGLEAKLKTIRKKIDANYKGEINEDNLKEYAIKGYVAGLGDEYTQYFTKDEMKQFTEETEGEFVGIGVYITANNDANRVEIVSDIKDSPAEKVGLQSGDLIKSVDGVEYTASDLDKITQNIRGKAGTKVKIVIIRNNEEKEYEIERASVSIPSVESSILENNVGYIYISTFSSNTSEEFKTAYNDLVSKGAKSLVIDLRNNVGGLLEEALDIGDMLTDKGKVLLIEEDKNNTEEKTFSKEDKLVDMNFVLLVNQYSASASEVLAGIVKDDCDNATIVGTTTYGKGVVQKLYGLSDGSGIKITTNEYFSPNHNSINKVGIKPDVEVEYDKFDGKLDTANDTQLQKAIEQLKNTNASK